MPEPETIENQQEKFCKTINFRIKSVNEEERSFWATASTETVDRDGDILRAKGWRLDNFIKNPAITFAHNIKELPIARAAEIRVENNVLRFKPVFPSKEIYPFADTVYQMYKNGFMNAFSVNFLPIEYKFIEGGKGGREFIEQELLEIAAVPVPSNFESLKDKGFQELITKFYNPLKKDIPPVITEPTKPEPVKLSVENLIPINDLDKYIKINEILKSGRVISQKNREMIQGCIDQLNQSISALQGLMDMTQGDDGKSTPIIDVKNILDEIALLKGKR